MKSKTMIQELSGYISFNVLGMLGLSCYILADTFFVARGLGTKGLTALNLAISIYSFIHGTGLMLGIGAATKYTILRAQKEEEKANRVFSHAVIMGLVVGLTFLLIGIFASEPLCKILGANQETLALTNVYLKTLLCFSPCFILNNIMLAFVRNDGSPNLSMVGMVVGSFVNIVLDYVFIFPLGMGMFGAALATGIAPVVSLLILSIHAIQKKNTFHFKRTKWRVHVAGEVMRLGLSAFVNEVSSGVVLITFNLIILGLAGNVGVAAYGIIANVSLVVLAIFTGIGQGMQPVVSRSYGSGDARSIRTVLRYVITLSLVLSVVIYAVISLSAHPIVAIFNTENNQILAGYAVTGIHLYFIGILFAGLNVVATAFLSAIEKAKQAFLISVMRGCVVLIPMAFLLSYCFQMNGVWMSFPSTEFITCVVSVVCFYKVLRVQKEAK